MWSTECLVNTVNIPNECKHDLFDEAQDYEEELWNDLDEVTDENGRLSFNPDHMESMDYLGTHDKALAILKRYKVEGDVCFGSLEGDNAGSFWGYRFDGKGGMQYLKGCLVWKEKKVGALEGKNIVITGSFKSISWTTRKGVEEKIREEGGKISGAVSKNTDLLVVGDDPGSKLQKAKQLGIETISGKDFLKMLGLEEGGWVGEEL